MGFLKRLFGGDKQDEPAKGKRPPEPPPARRRPPPEPAPSATPAAEDLAALPTRKLVRQLGADKAETRARAAEILAGRSDPTAVRPLLNAYLSYGDAATLDALRGYGKDVAAAAAHEARDPSVIGPRRARLMHVLGAAGDPEVIPAVRDNVEDDDLDIHVAACVALAELGDAHGVDLLAKELQVQHPERQRAALEALRGLDVPDAHKAVTAHVNRYLSQTGAIPEAIEIHAPRLRDPSIRLSRYVAEHIAREPHDLTVVAASGAIQLATSRADEMRRILDGFELHLNTPLLAPEEQIGALEAARDTAAAGQGARVVVLGKLPAPHDNPPLPHFLTRPTASAGKPYTAKILLVDPHECNLVMDWWRYVEDQAEVETDFEVILNISRPENSAISREEYSIYELMPEERRHDFQRAFLAHT